MTANNTESKGKRFGCGFVAGLVLVISFTAGTTGYGNGIGALMFVLGIALVFGLAAMLFGDSFWRWAGKWLP